jgi:single-strand DNA-binding protein
MSEQYINKIDLVGRVGQEPDIKYFESGAVKANLTLAVKPPYKSETPMWWDLELWGKQAEVAASYTHKGSTIGFSGELKFELWVDKNTGLPRSKPIIKVNELDLISSSKREDIGTSSTTQFSKSDVPNANF